MISVRRLLVSVFLIYLMAAAPAFSGTFEDLFHDETLRIDYNHTGNAADEFVSLDQLWRQGAWAGSRTHLIDELDLGRYYAKIYDAASGQLIWSRGFDSYFGEWQTTGPAGEGVLRNYHESVLSHWNHATPTVPFRNSSAPPSIPKVGPCAWIPRRRGSSSSRVSSGATPTVASISPSWVRGTPQPKPPSSKPT